MSAFAPLTARFLVGPTASGKTGVAQWIAEQDQIDVLSADSMLVYTGMDVGTAKPCATERGTVTYHGIDLVTPDQPFSVGAYRRHALAALKASAQTGQDCLVVGGTGLYIKSLTDGLDDAPPPDPARRQHWEAILDREGIDGLSTALQARSPDLFKALADKQNARRLIRALERCDAGITQAPRGWAATPVHAPLAALRLSSTDLKSRIESRVHTMYAHGLLEEVATLRARYSDLSKTAVGAIGYAEAAAVLDREISVAEAQEQTVRRTWQLARRQMTWFRRQANVHWIDVMTGMTPPDIAARVLEHWRDHGPTIIAP